MSAPNLTEEQDLMNIPELGDILTVKSTVFGRLTGKIIFRDENLVRIIPIDASDRAYDLVMDPSDGDFAPETGVTECIIHTKRENPHFVLQLGVVPGEVLEFFTNAGQVANPSGVVSEIIADEANDAVVLADGRRLDFMFIGPPSPIQVIRVSALSEGKEGDRSEGTDAEGNEPEEDESPELYDLSLLEGLIPAAMMEEIPTADRTYPEIIQREEMYLDLLKSYPESKHKNPNLLRQLARETELLLALKHAATITDEKGQGKPFIKSAKSLKDVLTNLGSPLSSLVPVIAMKRILYTDIESGSASDQEMLEQVEFRDGLMNELRLVRASASYLAGQEAGGAAQVSKLMYTYLYDILYRDGAVFLPNSKSNEGEEITVDQEVLRTVLPPEPVLGYSKMSAGAELDNSFVGEIKTRQHRVISSFKSRDQSVIAPGDPGTATNYLLFPTNVGSSFRPVKFSGSVAEDIRAANLAYNLPSIENLTNVESTYNPNGVVIVKGVTNPAGEGVSADEIKVAEWLATNLENSVHPSDMLSSGSVGIFRVLDSIGLRSYEWTPEVATVLWTAVRRAQRIYKKEFTAYSAGISEFLKTAPLYKFGDVIPGDSTLFKKVMEIPEIASVLTPMGEASDLLKAQKLLYSNGGTLARLLYLASSSEKHPHLNQVKRTYLAELYRAKIDFEHVNSASALKAAPTINTCPHIRDMDVLRSVMKTDNPKFYAVLQKVLTRYQGARSNNWVDCKVCDGHLICIHEVMMLYERTHPGKAQALHKEILLDFGGAAFSGRYVCRFCGVPISEFEYDTHLEYDDEGRPLIGRNILDDNEKTVEDELDSILNISVKKKSASYDDPLKNELYDVTRVMVQNLGFSFEEAHYMSIVEFAYNFVTTQLPPKDRYEALTAKKKIRPSYESFKATNEVAVTAAYVLCLIHTMSPAPEILFPFAGCNFRRGGYPIETDDVSVIGCMEYMVCVIANLNRDSVPWNMCMWSTESSPEKRKEIVRGWMNSMLSGKDLTVLKKQAQQVYLDTIKSAQGKASSSDIIPSHFRPTPNSQPAFFEATIMVHPDRIIESALKGDDMTETIVAQRVHQLACDSVMNAHLAAQTSGIISETSVRSDSVCCFSPIKNVMMGRMAMFSSDDVEQEISALQIAEMILRKKDPCQQSNGSHLYVHWSSPEAIESTPVKPDASYFKLFMRTCFRGERLGERHEFGRRSDTYECRHCRFKLNIDPLILMSDLNDEELFNSDSKRKGEERVVAQNMARQSLSNNGVTVNAESFKELLSAVRSNRMIPAFVEPVAKSATDIFETLNMLVNTDCPFQPVRLGDWEALMEIMSANFARKSEPTESTRKVSWMPFVTRFDSLRSGLVDVLDGRQGRGAVKKAAKKVETVILAIERITTEPMYQGPNEVNKHWIVGLERLAQNFSEMVFGAGTWFGQNVGNAKPIQNYLFNGTKWFGKKISQKHTAKFESMIQTILGATTDTNKELSRPEIRKFSSDITHSLSTYLGRIIRFWSAEMSSFSVYGVTTEEIQYMLRWLIFSSVEALLLTESPLYMLVPRDAEKSQIQAILLRWTGETFLEAQRQFDLFGLTEDEIKMAILDAREKEKNSVIKEIDDEKDPDLKAVALIQKNLKIGRWAIGTAKNLSSYNADFQDFLQEQRDRAGIADNGIMKPKKEDALGFDMSKVEDSGYDVYDDQHEDADGGDE